ncbi:MAG: hypothetical protein V3U32_04730, partial [Anaerolineales bacterium]
MVLDSRRSDLRNGVLLAAIPLFLLLPFLLNSHTLLLSRSELGTDYVAKQLPNAIYLQKEWSENGRLPAWRPETMSGIPIVGNPSYLTAYPFYSLILVLPVPLALNLLFALHIGLAGVGMYAFARVRLGFLGLGAFCSAIAYALAPKILAHVSGGQLDVLIALAWLPWIFLAFDRALENLSPLWGWVAGLLFAYAFLAHPPTALLIFIVIFAYGLYLAIRHQPAAIFGLERSRMVLSALLVGIAAMVGFLLIAAAHLAPMMELLPFLHRSDFTLTDATAFALPPSLLALILTIPNVPFPEWIVYIGLAIFIFASHAIFRDQVWGKPFWLTLGITSALFALGTSTPLFELAFQIIPGLSFLRVPSRAWFFVSFALAVFCGAGVDSFMESRGDFRLAAAIGLLLLAASALVVLPPQNSWQWIALAAAMVTGATIIILDRISKSRNAQRWVGISVASMLILELAAVGWSFWQPGETPVAPDWLEGIRFNTTDRVYTEGRISPYVSANEELWIVEGVDAVQLGHYVSFVEAATNCRHHTYSGSVPAFVISAEAAVVCPPGQVDSYLMGLLGVHRVITSEDQTGPGWVLEGSIKDGNLYRNNNVRPQAFLAYATQPTVSDENLIERLAESSPSDPLLVIGGRQLTGSKDISSSVDARWITSDQFELEITSSAPGFVVASVPYMPGWKAFDQDRIEVP